MIKWLLAVIALAAGPMAVGQHSGPNLGRVPVTGQDVNTISITPVAPVEGQPLIQVEAAPLPDLSPDRMTEAYLDGLFAAQIAAGRIPGAAIVIVRNGQIVLKKGYGFADLEKRTPVDPDRTRFRVASISKLFTALAAMQEVEAGRLDLGADVNAKLTTFKLAPVGGAPVTLASLLAHTSGFDDKIVGEATPLDAPRETLEAHLMKNMPRLVLESGKVFNYSNYGYALAGLLAAQSAGVSFDQMMNGRFFDPLQMTRSGFGVPVPVPSEMAKPYSRTPTGLKPGRLNQLAPGPAGDLVTTADDLSRFMLALVNDGGGLVRPETFHQMLAAQIVPGATGDAWGLGFALGENNGVKWFGHGGAWPGFAAELRLNLETKSGFLVLFNTDNQFDLVQPIVNVVTDRLWPPGKTEPRPNPTEAFQNAAALEGAFIPVRRVRADFTKFGAALATIRLKRETGGALTGTSGGLPQTLKFEPLREGVWIERTFRWRLSAYNGQGGAGDGILLGPFAYERAGFSADLQAQVPMVILASMAFALVLLFWAASSVSRRAFGEPLAAIPFWPRVAGAVAAFGGLVFLAGLVTAISSLQDADVLEGRLGTLPLLLVLPCVLAALTPVLGYFAVRGFGPSLRARLAQGGYGLLTLSLVFVLWFAWTWNLHIFAR